MVINLQFRRKLRHFWKRALLHFARDTSASFLQSLHWLRQLHYKFNIVYRPCDRSQWPRGQRRRSAAARLLKLWVLIPPRVWTFVCCECRVLSGRGICDELITRPEESYRQWCVVVCDLETSWMRRPWLTEGCRAKNKQTPSVQLTYIYK
jgi:hypothetical protein